MNGLWSQSDLIGHLPHSGDVIDHDDVANGLDWNLDAVETEQGILTLILE